MRSIATTSRTPTRPERLGHHAAARIQRVHVGPDDDKSGPGKPITFRFLQPTIRSLTDGTGIGVAGWGRVWLLVLANYQGVDWVLYAAVAGTGLYVLKRTFSVAD